MGKKRNYSIMLCGMAAVLVFVYLINDSYYQNLMETTGVEDEAGRLCDYQFDMIVGSAESDFWQAVYKSGKEKAEQENVLLELKGVAKDSQYNKIDYMNMSIAACADGIILENNGEEGLDEKINEAVRKGIPVVTVMSDATYSQRQGFVGVSDYQLGAAYGEQVAYYLTDDKEGKAEIRVLVKRNIDDENKGQIYSQIYNAPRKVLGNNTLVTVSVQNLMSSGAFDVEEVIRDICQQEEGPPDMLVCMDEEITECARQALIDFNLAGKVKVIGYYTSDNILDAVAKGVISSTCSINTRQLGEYSVQDLIDFKKDGRVNSYSNVDINFIGMEEAKALERRARNEKIALE